MAIAFHDDKQPCSGHSGYYRTGSPASVDICGFNWNQTVPWVKRTILHELGHAWVEHTVPDEIRRRFLDLRGLTTWDGDDTTWEEKGSEHAAEIISWALTDWGPMFTRMRDADPGRLTRAYELLTSTPPPSWARTPVTLIGALAPEDSRLISWAVSRFQEAGLVLPSVDIVFDPSGDACEGASGRFTDNGKEMRVALCTRQEGLTLTNRVVILHELAHA